MALKLALNLSLSSHVTLVEYIQRDIAEIKLDIREIKKDSRVDFRLLFGAILTMGVTLGGLMAKGFHWI